MKKTILSLFVSLVAYGQQVVADTDAKLIASAEQISSPYTEPSEGSIEAMLDGDPNTFWHSTWTGGSVSAGTHYFEVAATLPELFAITFTRRNVPNDHITRWGIYGAPSTNSTKEACRLLATWDTPYTTSTETFVSPVYESQGFNRLRFYCEDTYMSYEEGTRGYFHLSEFQILGTKEILVKGDMTNDGQTTIADVTSLINVVLGKAPIETITLSTQSNESGSGSDSSSPFAVDNSYVVGTWYASDGTHFTLGEDGTTDYSGGTTYKFYTGQNRLLILNSSERAVQVMPVVEATSSYLLTVDYTTGAPVYYTKSTSLAQVTGVTLSQTSLSMNSGTTAQLSATVAPSSAFNHAVTWVSSDESVATVDQNGLVTAVAGGSCIITATSADGSGVSAACTVSVTQMVTGIELAPRTLFLQLDEIVRLTTTVLPETAANKNVTWSSSDEEVATVRNGRIDAYGYGAATITCTAADGSGVSAKCMVYVIQDESELYVDLGLPSGTLWATWNIGATTPEDYGDYFAWGETEGYNGGRTTLFNWSTYKYCNGSETTLTKYCQDSSYGYNGYTDDLTELEPEDDAAYVNWGANWRMPSSAQFDELINSSYTTTEWTTQNGVYGRKITSISNGNSIFLPAVGYRYDVFLGGAGSGGNYWSRTLRTDYPCNVYFLDFNSGSIGVSEYCRFNGRSVRPVRNQ